jgi:hypothetical protein
MEREWPAANRDDSEPVTHFLPDWGFIRFERPLLIRSFAELRLTCPKLSA